MVRGIRCHRKAKKGQRMDTGFGKERVSASEQFQGKMEAADSSEWTEESAGGQRPCDYFKMILGT